MLKIHETIGDDGAAVETFLRARDGRVELVGPAGARALPAGALDAVLRRFGQPLDADASVHEVGALRLPDGRVLRHVRHLARFDVIAKDYLVLDVGDDVRCALATTAAGALDHLARAAEMAAPATAARD